MQGVLDRLGIQEVNSGAWAGAALDTSAGEILTSENPTTAQAIAGISLASRDDYENVVTEAARAFREWRMVPAPKRGDIVREMGDALRAHREDLGALVTLEVGKVLSEGVGEVQESVDIADFSVGLSRQLYGLSMHSERAQHRMYEQWHPIGPVGVITAFNFPNAVWAWNAMIALVCGDTVVWKPSLKSPLVAVATHRLMDQVLSRHGFSGALGLIIGSDQEVGEAMIRDRRFPLISATGSTRMGRHVGQVVAGRLGRSLLELGGNNAIIVEPDADPELAIGGILFGAVGTTGQRCTTTRRVFLHRDIAADFTRSLVDAYGQIRVGDPMESSTLMGPLIDAQAVEQYQAALQVIREQGGEILAGGDVLDRAGHFVQPTLVRAHPGMDVCREETFAPILYVFEYDDLSQAVHWQNDVPQGLSSAIFTDSFRSAERFLSHQGSDCGIANVNIGTSGAEIGGAFGGEKDTGGGREAGSDSWKNYMRRQTCTLNWGETLPLAQGVEFKL
ncbi:MAG: aldehyde dehydrogenase family protein [Myxococcota bacterium]|nr:aldehyde dehydrogenase family protein [Myxococcota bacterium]